MEIGNERINVNIIPFRQLIAVLAQDGIIRFIDPHTCQLQSEVGSSARVSRIVNYYCEQIKRGVLSLTSFFSFITVIYFSKFVWLLHNMKLVDL